jgi:hypothetical protein
MAGCLADFDGCRLAIECRQPGCSTGRAFEVKMLAKFYPPKLTIGAAIGRMRCERCRKPPVEVRLIPPPRGEPVILVGPGAY